MTLTDTSGPHGRMGSEPEIGLCGHGMDSRSTLCTGIVTVNRLSPQSLAFP